jgi:hypothetical protein
VCHYGRVSGVHGWAGAEVGTEAGAETARPLTAPGEHVESGRLSETETGSMIRSDRIDGENEEQSQIIYIGEVYHSSSRITDL